MKHGSRRRGGALSDYIPSAISNAASAAYNYLPSYSSAEASVPAPPQYEIPEAPPLPSSFSATSLLPKSVLRTGRQAREIYDLGRNAYDVYSDVTSDPGKASRSKYASAINALKTFRPLYHIDAGLHKLGLRDKVRGALGKSSLGQSLLAGVDKGIQYGFGMPVRTYVPYYGAGVHSRRYMRHM